MRNKKLATTAIAATAAELILLLSSSPLVVPVVFVFSLPSLLPFVASGFCVGIGIACVGIILNDVVACGLGALATTLSSGETVEISIIYTSDQ